VEYDSLFTCDLSIEYFEFNPWRENRSNGISFVNRNYAKLKGGPYDLYDITEIYKLNQYKSYIYVNVKNGYGSRLLIFVAN